MNSFDMNLNEMLSGDKERSVKGRGRGGGGGLGSIKWQDVWRVERQKHGFEIHLICFFWGGQQGGLTQQGIHSPPHWNECKISPGSCHQAPLPLGIIMGFESMLGILSLSVCVCRDYPRSDVKPARRSEGN